MKLYSYWRSTTSYRVRIALNLKGLAFETCAIDLTKGAQFQDDYAALNPIKGVPTLVLEDGSILTQSMAILEYLDEAHPEPPLLTGTTVERAHQRAAAMVVAADIHPVNNLKVVKKFKAEGHDDAAGIEWMRHWMAEGLSAFQKEISADSPFCFGDAPALADICLIPQLYNAHRWGLDLDPLGRLLEIEARCLALPAFDAARPENQPDATA